MKKRFLVGCVLISLLLCAFALAQAEVVSTTPIVGERFWGFRVLGVAVEYDHDLDAQELATDAFLATDSWETGVPETAQVMLERQNARVYTNSEAALLTEGSAAGRYVVVEFVDDPLAVERPGEFPQRGYFVNAEGKTEKPRVVKPNVGTVRQLVDLKAADGTVLAATDTLTMTNDYLVPDYVKAFERVEIPLEGSESSYVAFVRLPDGYDASKTYPVIFNITGGGQLRYVNEAYDNTDIVLYNDHQLYAWTETRDYGFDVDYIVVSLRHKNTSISLKVEGEDPYEDTAAAAKWIIENYPVDRKHMIWCGQSQGSVTCLNVLWRHPELATGYFATNGGLSPIADFSPEGWTQDWYDKTVECLRTYVDHGIKTCFTFGEQDGNSANAYAAKVYYEILHDAWAEKGLSEREIDDMAKVRVFPHSTYAMAEGLTDHNVCRVMYWLDVTKIDAMKIVTGW